MKNNGFIHDVDAALRLYNDETRAAVTERRITQEFLGKNPLPDTEIVRCDTGRMVKDVTDG